MKTVAIIGTFDTKGEEFAYVKSRFAELGIDTLTIHSGVFDPQFPPDISNAEVAEAAGADIAEIKEKKDRALATETMTSGVENLIPTLYKEINFDGVFSMGGSGGTTIATAGMRKLPIGVPKLIVSTMASGDTSPYVGASDIVMFPSIVDVQGLNSISTTIYDNAVAAMAGMIENPHIGKADEKPLIAASMFGVTTPAVQKAQKYLEDHGYEVLVFHATGTGGKAMESLIENGFISGVLDLTTTEWCDEIVGGVLAAGPDRCSAAARNGIPTVLSTGALDMVNFGPYDTVPEQFMGRNLYKHNPTVTLMRTTVDENRQIAQAIANNVNLSDGSCVVMLPLKGVSMIDAEGQPFYGPEEDAVLFDTLRESISPDAASIVEIDANINDDEFAIAAAKQLIDLMEGQKDG
ncbi:MAG: Tm-1-like ATP-binding domain-containing protein [Eggerthellaceae bacterium]|nr:Tm-1-like ATP-binding domain-containing protein [Eggerthellaceae bacterium]